MVFDLTIIVISLYGKIKLKEVFCKGVKRMICTVTFNPSMDYIVGTETFRLGAANRTSSEQMLVGGKGINVSYVLKFGYDLQGYHGSSCGEGY